MLIKPGIIKNSLISVGLIAAVLLAVWTSVLSMHPRAIVVANTSSLPDAIMEDVTAVIMDKNGKPTLKIVTPKMIHYTDNDTTHLTMPQLTLYRKSPQPWFITAKHGKASQGIDHVDFWEDVIVHHPADLNNPATLIKTLKLTVHPEKQVAETKEFITLIQPNIVVKAIGMYADMESGDIKLLSQARGEYVPNL